MVAVLVVDVAPFLSCGRVRHVVLADARVVLREQQREVAVAAACRRSASGIVHVDLGADGDRGAVDRVGEVRALLGHDDRAVEAVRLALVGAEVGDQRGAELRPCRRRAGRCAGAPTATVCSGVKPALTPLEPGVAQQAVGVERDAAEGPLVLQRDDHAVAGRDVQHERLGLVGAPLRRLGQAGGHEGGAGRRR